MHAISFQLKRAHLVTAAYAQKAVERVPGMTPARYDVLALLRETGIATGTTMPLAYAKMWQWQIQERLGLHHSTISKMLKRMEEMGWLTREIDPYSRDKRWKKVRLTQLGLRRAWQAMRRVYRGRLLLEPFERIARMLRPKEHVVAALESIWSTIDGIARFFNDRSWFHSQPPRLPSGNGAYELVPRERCANAWAMLHEMTTRARRNSWTRYKKHRTKYAGIWNPLRYSDHQTLALPERAHRGRPIRWFDGA